MKRKHLHFEQISRVAFVFILSFSVCRVFAQGVSFLCIAGYGCIYHYHTAEKQHSSFQKVSDNLFSTSDLIGDMTAGHYHFVDASSFFFVKYENQLTKFCIYNFIKKNISELYALSYSEALIDTVFCTGNFVYTLERERMDGQKTSSDFARKLVKRSLDSKKVVSQLYLPILDKYIDIYRTYSRKYITIDEKNDLLFIDISTGNGDFAAKGWTRKDFTVCLSLKTGIEICTLKGRFLSCSSDGSKIYYSRGKIPYVVGNVIYEFCFSSGNLQELSISTKKSEYVSFFHEIGDDSFFICLEQQKSYLPGQILFGSGHVYTAEYFIYRRNGNTLEKHEKIIKKSDNLTVADILYGDSMNKR